MNTLISSLTKKVLEILPRSLFFWFRSDFISYDIHHRISHHKSIWNMGNNCFCDATNYKEIYIVPTIPQKSSYMESPKDIKFPVLMYTPCSIMETGYWNFPDGEHFASSSSLYTQMLAQEVELFLREFQTNTPLVPFLHSVSTTILSNIMERFVEILKAASPVNVVDVSKKENILSLKKIDLGFATRSELKKSNDTDLQILQFRSDCRKCLQKCVVKILERSPPAYGLTKAVTCFDLSIITANPTIATKWLETLLSTLVDARWLAGTTADKAA
ncbi:unnamed protein product [Timema podura]|uniref:Uncharacterized protein n=1 Tax=Timema podura TaxID=61482 RepID=A0ABN7NQL0_TIMPD|nr:unnamed protein product [Timema podura]